MERGKPNYLVGSGVKKCTTTDKQSAGTGLGHGRKGCIDFLLAARLDNNDFLPDGASGRLYFAGLTLECLRVWVLQSGDDFGLGYQLMQQREPFAGNRNVIKAHASHVAARSTYAGHEPFRLRIATSHENNRNAFRSRLCCPRRWNATSDNRGYRKGDQFSGKLR